VLVPLQVAGERNKNTTLKNSQNVLTTNSIYAKNLQARWKLFAKFLNTLS